MRRHIGIMFGHGLVIALMVGFLIGFSPAVFTLNCAFADGTDNFNDNSKDPALWGLDEVKGQGQLNEINGRLEYTTTGSGTILDSSDRRWIATKFPYNGDWQIQIDVTNTASSPTFSSFGIVVESARLPDNEIEIELGQSGLFWAEFRGGTLISGDDTALAFGPNTHGAILLSFDSTSKVFTVYYDSDTSDGYQWQQFGSFGVVNTATAVNVRNWGLNNSDQFIAYVFGYSERISVTSGELYGDNLGETGGIPLPPIELVFNEGTTGTEITITGADFGTKKGKVLLGVGGKTKLKIAKDGWRDDRIVGTVSKVPLPAGSYPAPFGVMIQTKHKPPQSLITTDTFTVTNPVITTPLPTPSGDIGDEIEISGKFFGAKKGKVYLEYLDGVVTKKKNCKVTSWSMTPATGDSTVRFIVPTLPTDVYPLYVSNKKVGTSQAGIDFGIGLAPSDRNLKENIAPIDGKEVLTRLAGIPVSSWNYKNQGPSIRHIGPMAQDFQSAFHVGESDRFINMVDSGGVALASIQGLYTILQEKEREIRSLKNENLELKEEIRDIGKRLAAIENQTPK
jgi:hypothetical protein